MGRRQDRGDAKKAPRGFMPFHPKFGPLIHDDAKTATARRKRYGSPGDALLTPFGPIVLVEVREARLDSIARDHWAEEGTRSPGDFVDTWNDLFPETPFRGDEVVWLHRFRRADPGEVGEGGASHG